jgi:hypothetical protein
MYFISFIGNEDYLRWISRWSLACNLHVPKIPARSVLYATLFTINMEARRNIEVIFYNYNIVENVVS